MEAHAAGQARLPSRVHLPAYTVPLWLGLRPPGLFPPWPMPRSHRTSLTSRHLQFPPGRAGGVLSRRYHRRLDMVQETLDGRRSLISSATVPCPPDSTPFCQIFLEVCIS